MTKQVVHIVTNMLQTIKALSFLCMAVPPATNRLLEIMSPWQYFALSPVCLPFTRSYIWTVRHKTGNVNRLVHFTYLDCEIRCWHAKKWKKGNKYHEKRKPSSKEGKWQCKIFRHYKSGPLTLWFTVIHWLFRLSEMFPREYKFFLAFRSLEHLALSLAVPWKAFICCRNIGIPL